MRASSKSRFQAINSMKFSPARSVAELRGGAGLVALAALLLLAMLSSLALGRYPLPVTTIPDVLLRPFGAGGGATDDTAETILLLVRLPRILAAVLIGASLALSGLAYQTIFRNPMASPALLGVSAGAGFGASVALLLRWPMFCVQGAGFAGGLAAVAIAIAANRALNTRSIVNLVLCGLVVSALFQALVSIVKYVADPIEVLPTITFWLMGSLAKVSQNDVWILMGPTLFGALTLYLNRWRISLLALGEHEAAALGVDVPRLRAIVIGCATMMSASTVCVAGVIGWVGLLIPHLARAAFGMEPARLTIATALLGGVFLLVVDDLARSISVIEVPLGVLTALIGAPFFLIFLMRAQRARWS
jgi:iron complex transport system permease protein